MYSFLYLITNDFYPDNVYKIDITQQNKKQLQKKYNKYYPDNSNVRILYSIIVKDKNETINRIKNLFTSISNNFFVKNNNINQLKNKIKKLVSFTDSNKVDSIKQFIELSCSYNKNNTFLLNDLYNLYISNNRKIDFIHFLYLIKQSNIKITEKDDKYFINNYILKHYNKNLYEEFIIHFNNKNKFVSINFLVNCYKKWHKQNYSYLKISHKSELKNNLIKSIENKYGKIKYNPYSMYSFGWII